MLQKRRMGMAWPSSSTTRLNDKQSARLNALERTTPVGKIKSISKFQTEPQASGNLNETDNYPFVPQQIVDLRGTSKTVPDNGDLWIVLHQYSNRESGTLVESSSLYYFTPANLLYGTSVVDQSWIAPGVSVGPSETPSEEASYRISLYFCSSSDSATIAGKLKNKKQRNAGLISIPGSSCKQLDSI